MNENEGCTHLNDLLKAERPIIKRHLQDHKWFTHIQNDNEAMGDFIEKYGFILREMYCNNICVDKDTCEVYKKNMAKYDKYV